METNLGLSKVGNYTIVQGETEDCLLCKNAKWGSIIVRFKKLGEEKFDYHKGFCLECILKILGKTEEYAQLLEIGLSSYEAREIIWPDGSRYYPSILKNGG